MNILIDMNLSPRWVARLERAGIEAQHWSTLGAHTASDASIMAHAKASGHIVLTSDLDFGNILAVTHGDKPSVVQIRAENVSPDTIGDKVVAALLQMALELESGALLCIDTQRALEIASAESQRLLALPGT